MVHGNGSEQKSGMGSGMARSRALLSFIEASCRSQ